MPKQEDKKEEKQVEEQVEAREEVVEVEGSSIDESSPIERREEITMEEPEEVQELHVEIPADLQLSKEEMQKVAKEASNELLDTMSGDRALVRKISVKLIKAQRIQKVSRVTRISRITKLWRR